MQDKIKSATCAEFLKAVADPDRLKIIQCLQSGPKQVGEICRELNVPIANISHHLQLLKNAKLVSRQKQGRFVIYTLAPEFFRKATGSKLSALDFGCCRLELGEK